VRQQTRRRIAHPQIHTVLGIRSGCQDRIFNLVECLAYRLLGRVLRDPENFVKGPSIGFDIGGNAAKCFTLVYNLKETRQLFQRFPGVEGSLYFVGGFSLNYNRTDDVTLAPVRFGVGWRQGASVGYLHFTPKMSLIPI